MFDARRAAGDRGLTFTGYYQGAFFGAVAAQGGYQPDVLVCSDEVAAGRPAPWLNFRAAERLGIYPMDQLLVVDDTPLGIEAGKAAGCLTVAVSQTGNALGLGLEEMVALPEAELRARLGKIESNFRAAGAYFVIPSVAGLPEFLQINRLVND